MRARLRVVIAIVAAWVWAADSVVLAQSPEAGRPYRGLFPPPSPSGQSARAKPAGSFEFSIRAFGALERDSALTRPGGRPRGPYSALAADFARTHVSTRVSTDVRGSSQIRQQPSAGGFSMDTQWLAAGAQALLTPRTSISVAQRFAYSPLYSPAASAGNAGTTGAASNTNVTMATAAGLSRQISRRTTAGFAYGFDRVFFSNTGAAASTQRAAATVTRAMGRSLDVQLRASSLRSSPTGSAPATSVLDFTAGLVATPKKSRTLELTVGAMPGLSRRTEPRTADRSALPSGTRTSLVVDGFVRINRQLSKNVRADAGYQRLMYYLPGGDQLISANAVSGGVNGTVGRNVALSGSAAWSYGTPDQRAADQRVTSLTTSGRIEWRPARGASVFAELRRDTYSVSNGLTQLPGLSRRANSASVRIGMTMGFGGWR